MPCAEKEGLLAPLANSSLALLGSNPSNEKRQKPQFLTFALCGERGIARSARELVAGAPRFEPPKQKKAKALIPMLLPSAEKEGFEPPVRRKANNGFQDRRIRPLCHFSGGKSTAFFYSCKAKKGKSI